MIRRITTIILSLMLIGIVLAPAQMAAASSSSSSTLTFASSAALARRFTAILDQLPAQAFPTLHTQADLDNWTREIVPFFAYEHVVDPAKDPGEWGGLVYPASVSFENYQDGEKHTHVLGTTDCLADPPVVTINARYANPKSAFYTKHDAVLVLTHELAHVQNICFGSGPLDAENSAQLVALEVLAAMVNNGNPLAFGPLVNELRDMSLASAQYFAMRDHRLDDYQALLADVSGHASVDLAYFEQSQRYWAENDPAELQHILEAYNVVPMQAILAHLHDTECFYPRREYPVTHMEFLAEPCIHGVVLPINMQVFQVPLVIDDLAFVWAHAEALGRDFYPTT